MLSRLFIPTARFRVKALQLKNQVLDCVSYFFQAPTV